jgi:cell division protein FtsB
VRLATIVLLAMFAVLQYTLWLGKGGWLRIWSLERDIEAQALNQSRLREANAVGHADVEDLRSGLDGVDERARREIGMVRKDETFFQYPQGEATAAETSPAAGMAQDGAADGSVNGSNGATDGRLGQTKRDTTTR